MWLYITYVENEYTTNQQLIDTPIRLAEEGVVGAHVSPGNVGFLVGESDGEFVGFRVGDSDGEFVGLSVGDLVGVFVGMGAKVGCHVSPPRVGVLVGEEVGDFVVGDLVGTLVGLDEGFLVGDFVSLIVG